MIVNILNYRFSYYYQINKSIQNLDLLKEETSLYNLLVSLTVLTEKSTQKQ